MKKYKRIFVIVMDSLGIGAADDAAACGDAGTDAQPYRGVQKICYSESSEDRYGESASIKAGGSVGIGSATINEGAQCRGGYDDRAQELMGLCAEPFQTFTEHGFPQKVDR